MKPRPGCMPAGPGSAVSPVPALPPLFLRGTGERSPLLFLLSTAGFSASIVSQPVGKTSLSWLEQTRRAHPSPLFFAR